MQDEKEPGEGDQSSEGDARNQGDNMGEKSDQDAEQRVNELLNRALEDLPEISLEDESSVQSPIPMVSSETMQELVHELATPEGERELMMQMGQEQPFLIAYLARFSQILGLSDKEQDSIRSAITAMYSAIRREMEKAKK